MAFFKKIINGHLIAIIKKHKVKIVNKYSIKLHFFPKLEKL